MESKTITYTYCFKKIYGILKYVFLTLTPFVIYQLIQGNLNSLKYYYAWIRQGSALPVYWYFAAMIIIYLLLPTLKKLINSKYLLTFLIILFLLCQIVFALNIKFDFEKTYVYQAFRIWNWVFYFTLGMLVNKNPVLFNRINWWHTVLACLAFLLFRRLDMKGNEYYFCSFPNMIYVLCLFVNLNRIDFGQKSKTVISRLSTIFLPVYTIHWPIFLFCKSHGFYIHLPDPNSQIITNYIAFSVTITVLALLIMSLPYSDKLFKI